MHIYFTVLADWHSKSKEILNSMKMNVISTKYLSIVEVVCFRNISELISD